MKTAGQNLPRGSTGPCNGPFSKGGYVGVLASKFHAGHKRCGQQVTVTRDTTTVTITDPAEQPSLHAKLTERRG